MHQVTIIEQALLPEQDAYCSTCTYDQSGLKIWVLVTGQAIRDLNRFDCDLNAITKYAVEWALRQGITEGEVSLAPSAPEFSRFTTWLTEVFQKKRDG